MCRRRSARRSRFSAPTPRLSRHWSSRAARARTSGERNRAAGSAPTRNRESRVLRKAGTARAAALDSRSRRCAGGAAHGARDFPHRLRGFRGTGRVAPHAHGRVVNGIELLAVLPRGTGSLGFYEKPEQRVPLRSIRVAADVPEAQRTALEIFRTDSAAFAALVESRRTRTDEW